nr:MAG TPA: hypothetical protein [Caudoviricetes sp.]
MKTSVRASFELAEESALKNATLSADNNSDFCNISKLKTNIAEYTPFMTLEHNINVLDGTLETFNSSSYDLSYFSTNLSDENCVSTNEIVVSLAETQSIYGITFDFGNIDFLDQISVDYMKDSEIIKSYDLYPDYRYYTADISAESFNKIVIKFKSTRFPRMFTKMQYLYLGKIYNWDDEVISCEITENVNPISKEIKTNTCSLSVYSEENEFNALDPNGPFRYLGKNQKIKLYVDCDGTEYSFGLFFLDTWDASVKNVIKFNLISPIGILSKITCYDGWFCLNPIEIPYREGDTVYSALKKLFDNYTSDIYSNLSYSVSENLTTPLFGTIPYGDYKKVIQAIAFCSCASVNDTRDGVIKVSRIIENESSSEINLNNILGEIKVSLIESPSSVELHCYDYEIHDQSEDDKYKDLTRLDLIKGVKTKIASSKPIEYVRYKKSGDSQWTYLDDYGLYCFYFTPAETDTYIFQIIEMESDNAGFRIFNISNKINQVENVIKIDSDPLIFHGVDDNGNDNEFIENIKKYYGNVPYMVEFEFINNGTIKTGDVVTVETDLGYKIKGYLIEQNISLSGGMISKAKVIGDVVVSDGV